MATLPVEDDWWRLWAPPLDPPVDGGLPVGVAQAIADKFACCDPHLVAALQWEAWAGMLLPTQPVASVSTGIQSVAYASGSDGGKAGLAMQRAAWHRSFIQGEIVSVPLTVPVPPRHRAAVPYDWPGWERFW